MTDDAAFGHWLAGLFDGEGSFAIARREDGFACKGAVVLRDDDLPILREIQARTGFGRLYRRKPTAERHKPGAEWSVATKRECLQMVELFEAFPLRAKKARDFEIWARAVRAWHAIAPGNNVYRTADWSGIAALRAELANVRQYEAGDWPEAPLSPQLVLA